MNNWKEFFADKKVTLMGLGILGRGAEDAVFLARYSKHLHITDLKTEDELKTSLEKLKEFKNISYTLREHRPEDFRNVDMIVKSAGVPPDSIYVAEAQKAGVPVYMSAALFAKFFKELVDSGKCRSHQLIGVTGTKGKTTVSYLIHHILEENFKDQRVRLGGNAYSGSTLSFLEDMGSDDLVVLELDSWQLQGFGDLKISPHIAVFTSFFPDHMNYYKGDMERYFEDKANIFKYQDMGRRFFGGRLVIGGDSYLVADDSALAWIQKYYPEHHVATGMSVYDEEQVRNWKMPLPGEHNVGNVLLAVGAVTPFGMAVEDLQEFVENFKGVPGRLELVREVDGVKFYNDTTATNPTATLASLRALSSRKNIILIAGGADKGLEVSELATEIPNYAKKVVLLPGTGTDRLSLVEDVLVVKSMEEAVNVAKEVAGPGDVVLLSPGFASFGLFANEFDRGGQFVKVVKGL
jgi:UDP-N-acetylmuramoylalanine--D-glutamate ligase